MIVGWRSPLDGKVYPLDAFEDMGRVVPEPVLRAMSRKVETDTRHKGTNVTITAALSCPRKTLVTRMLPTTPDPSLMWKMQRGTWLHECVGLSLGENKDWITEEIDADACTFEGELFGIPLSCRVDALKRDDSMLVDWKFRGDGAERWISPSGVAKDEDAAQLNMARMLIEQTRGVELPDMQMYVWVMAGQTVRTTVPYMTEDQVGNIYPGGAQHTLLEILCETYKGMLEWRALADEHHDGDLYAVPRSKLQQIIHARPMVGEYMYRNNRNPSLNMCTRYCEVQDECFACEGGI